MFHIFFFLPPSHTHVHTETHHNLYSSNMFQCAEININGTLILKQCVFLVLATCTESFLLYTDMFILIYRYSTTLSIFSSFQNQKNFRGDLNRHDDQSYLIFFVVVSFLELHPVSDIAYVLLFLTEILPLTGVFSCQSQFQTLSLESDHYTPLQTNEHGICCSM